MFLPPVVFQQLSPSCVFASDKARLEELKGKLSAKKGSAQMYPIDFEKVEHKDTSAAHSTEAADSDREETGP